MSNLVLGIPVPFLGYFRKKWAIRSYTRRLPKLLARNYGASYAYTPRQIKTTIEKSGLNLDYSCYAMAMFSNREDFSQFHTDIGEYCDYDSMRLEISHEYFDGATDFSIFDIFSLSPGGSDSMFEAHHDGGADGHGGDGGHGGGGDGGH